eukprot:9526773-Alexandrium_andersonii.AAC.1
MRGDEGRHLLEAEGRPYAVREGSNGERPELLHRGRKGLSLVRLLRQEGGSPGEKSARPVASGLGGGEYGRQGQEATVRLEKQVLRGKPIRA